MSGRWYSKFLAGVGTSLILFSMVGTSAMAASLPGNAALPVRILTELPGLNSNQALNDIPDNINSNTIRVSVGSDGSQGNSTSRFVGGGGYDSGNGNYISDDGNLIVFVSYATNLVAGDTNGFGDIFLRDQSTQETQRISMGINNAQSDYSSYSPSISSGGRFIVFESGASNLVPNDTQMCNTWLGSINCPDIFVFDRVTETMSLVSKSSLGQQGNAYSYSPNISADGRYVVFASDAGNLVPNDTNYCARSGIPNCPDIFVHDMQTGETKRVSIASDGSQSNDQSFNPSISGDGRFISYISFASNLVTGDTNNSEDTFVYDQQTGQTIRVSIASDGSQAEIGGYGLISSSGRYVLFVSGANNLTGQQSKTCIFVRDLETQITSLINIPCASNGSFNPLKISSDGQTILFSSSESNVIPNDTNGKYDVFSYNRTTDRVNLISISSDGLQSNGDSMYGSMSNNGRYIAFESDATNLVVNDTNGSADIFVHESQAVSEGAVFEERFDNDLSQWNLFGISPPFIDTTFGNPIPSYQNGGNGANNGALTKAVFTPIPGMIFKVDIQISAFALENGFVFGLSRTFNPTPSSQDLRVFLYIDGPRSRIEVADCGLIYPSDFSFNHFKFIVRDDYRLDIYTGESETFNCTSSFSVSEFVNKPLLIAGRQGHMDNVLVYAPTTPVTYSISGHVTDDSSNAIAAVAISDGSGHATFTNNNGDYILSGLPAGNYLLAPSKAGLFFTPTNRLVTIAQSDVTQQNFTGMAINCSNATATQPILLVTGWPGSMNKTLANDDNLNLLYSSLQSKHYLEGCNLFYAEGTDPSKKQDENAKIIQDDLCQASQTVQLIYPNWTGSFDIIGHSYGGLRARAYLENPNLYEKCTINDQKPRVRNLITLGTPHDGDSPDLPLSFLIGLNAIVHFSDNTPAIVEMFSGLRIEYNLTHSQPENVNYYLIAGDSRTQTVPLPLSILSSLFPGYILYPSDMAVHEYSGHALGLPPLQYPRITLISTDDVHGRSSEWIVTGLNQMTSYINSSSTFNNSIWPIINGSYSGTISNSTTASKDQSGVTDSIEHWVAQQSDATSTTDLAQMDITSGVLSGSQSVAGSFEITGSSDTSILFVWDAGNVNLDLIDPTGSIIPQDSNYASFDGGFGWITIYHLPNPQVGTWIYVISGQALVNPAIYRLAAIPATPITVVGSLPSWLPNNSPVVITANVAYDGTTPVTGGTVSATIQRPDSTSESIELLDDGNHQDGAANDGLFGASYTNTSLGGIFGVLFTATGSYNSESYTRTATANFAIAPASASVGTNYTDQGIDDNSDGVYEWLELSTPVVITQAGKYMVSAELYAGSVFIGQTFTESTLDAGIQGIPLRFAGKDIFDNKVDGPYTLRNLMLFDENYATVLIQAGDNVYTTGAYQYLQFATKPFISGNTGVAGVTLSYTDGTVKTATSASDGSYSFNVSYDWSGAVTPSRVGYKFFPASRTYNNIQADQTGQNFASIRIRDDYDGDGKTDPAKFISSAGAVWWLKSSTGLWDGKWLGSDSFTYAGASDYDGDGKTDPAKFYPATGTVWWVKSSTGTLDGQWLGPDTFTYITGSDFDGDGRSDPAKFYPATGTVWWVKSSTGILDGQWLGPDTFTYITGSDFDGDGKTDPAKFYPASGTVWWVKSTTHTIDGMWLGPDTFTYVPASDFDGDGKTDPAKFYPATGTVWWVKSTTHTLDGAWLGPGTFTYVAGCDFDGDGKTDPTKYVASTHILSWLKSTTGTWSSVSLGTGTYTLALGK